MIDFTETEEEQQLVELAKRFGADRLTPHERTHERGGFPDALRAEYADVGFADMDGLPVQIQARVWMALAEADPAAPLALAPGEPQGTLSLRMPGCATVPVPDVPARTQRLFAASLLVGAARYAYAYCRDYTTERVVMGKPIAHHQGIAFQLVECVTRLDAAECLVLASAGAAPAVQANAYLLAIDAADFTVDRAVQFLGGHGYLHDHPVEKRMRDVRAIALLWGGAPAARAEARRVLDLPDEMELIA